MTEPKILSPQEALRVLADGQKLTIPGYATYIVLNFGVIVWEDGSTFSSDFTGLVLHTEPKPKRKVAPYYVEYPHSYTILEDNCFETDEEAQKFYGRDVTVTRCTALEIEV